MKLVAALLAVLLTAAGANAQDRTGSNPGARNPREKSDAPQKDPKVLSDREAEDLLPASQTQASGKDANARADANDTWIEWFADLVDEDDASSGNQAGSSKEGQKSFKGGAQQRQSQSTRTITGFINRHDSNDDRALSEDELPQGLRQGWRQLDRNKDGKLTADELRHHSRSQRMARMPVVVTHVWLLDTHAGRIGLEDLQKAYDSLSQIDEDSDGKLTRKELEARQKEIAHKWIDQCLENHDDNDDGRLTREEARGTGVAARFGKFDADDDGQVTKKELTTAFADNRPESASKPEESRN
jgi:Ca2+-binding EF-hand superfamily protein